MVYYDMNNHRLLGFEASENKNKMYNAILLLYYNKYYNDKNNNQRLRL